MKQLMLITSNANLIIRHQSQTQTVIHPITTTHTNEITSQHTSQHTIQLSVINTKALCILKSAILQCTKSDQKVYQLTTGYSRPAAKQKHKLQT